MSSRAATYNIKLDRNADWVKILTINDNDGDPVNISGASFEGAIKTGTGRPLVASFAFTLISSGTTGQVRIQLTDTESLKLAPNQQYRYEVSMVLSGIRRSLIKGTLEVDPNQN
jgi:hypothetical protein